VNNLVFIHLNIPKCFVFLWGYKIIKLNVIRMAYYKDAAFIFIFIFYGL